MTKCDYLISVLKDEDVYTDSQSRWTSAFPSTGECCSFGCWSQEKDEALPGLELKCIEENEEDQLEKE